MESEMASILIRSSGDFHAHYSLKSTVTGYFKRKYKLEKKKVALIIQ